MQQSKSIRYFCLDHWCNIDSPSYSVDSKAFSNSAAVAACEILTVFPFKTIVSDSIFVLYLTADIATFARQTATVF